MRDYDSSIEREEKRLAYQTAFGSFLSHGDGSPRAVRCAVLMPSMTCMDIDMLMPWFDEGTRLICIENFSYIHCSEREWMDTVAEHASPMIPRDSIHFHRGDIEELQLGAVLRMLGVDFVDLMFLDLCGELTPRQCRWIWDNRCLFQQGSPLLFTIDLQPSVINGCSRFDKRMEMDSSYGKCEYEVVGKTSRMTDRILASIQKWGFVVSHLVNGNAKTSLCRSVIYKSGGDRHKMMLAYTPACWLKSDEYRHAYYDGFFRNGESDESILNWEGIDWGSYGGASNRNVAYPIRQNDVLLFQNREVSSDRFDYRRFYDYFLSNVGRRKPANERRFKPDRIKNCISSCSMGNFPPELYDGRYKSTRLYFAKCEQIYRRIVAGVEYDYDGLMVKFDDQYNILFRNREGEFVGYLDHFDEAFGMYKELNGCASDEGECRSLMTLK